MSESQNISSSLDRMFTRRNRIPKLLIGSVVVAAGLHVGAAFGLASSRAEASERVAVLEVDLTPPPPPRAPTTPPPEPPAPSALPETKAEESLAPKALHDAKPLAAQPAAAPPAAAKAGALLTAKDDGQKTPGDEPVTFVTDPNGKGYGSGVVALGGTADHGAPGANAKGIVGGTGPATSTGTAKVPAPIAPVEAIVSAANLSRTAKLEEANACKGFFPSDADSDVGNVAVVVTVRANGSVASASLVSETPAGQGFGKAARSCLSSKTFTPALDKDGKTVMSSTTVRIHFSR